jgi:hypothetical protein
VLSQRRDGFQRILLLLSRPSCVVVAPRRSLGPTATAPLSAQRTTSREDAHAPVAVRVGAELLSQRRELSVQLHEAV